MLVMTSYTYKQQVFNGTLLRQLLNCTNIPKIMYSSTNYRGGKGVLKQRNFGKEVVTV